MTYSPPEAPLKRIKVVAFDLGNTLMRDDFSETRSLRMMPGALDAVQALYGRVMMVVATNSNYPPEHTINLLERLKLRGFFHEFFTAHNMNALKPDKEFYGRMLETLGIEAHECVMVGDSYYTDVQGANVLGMHTIWVAGSRAEEEEKPPAADVMVATLHSVPDAVFAIDNLPA
jgi:HAD superfamily hydrolase (TIGR01662 family)